MYRILFIFSVFIFSFILSQEKIIRSQTYNGQNTDQAQNQESLDIPASENNVNINTRNSRSFSESFEWQVFPPYKWYFYSNNWLNDISRSASTAHSGDYSARFCSKEAVFDPFGAYTHDQYMISPKLNVGEGESFSFWHNQSDWSGEKFMIGISTTDQSLESFTYGPEFTRDNGSAGVWVQHIEDLSAYEGQEIYVSIRYTSIWKHYLYIDNVEGPAIVVDTEPDAYYSADTLNFSETYIQSFSSLELIIGNGGGSDLTVTLSSNNSNFEIGSYSNTLAPGAEEVITITYTPTEVHNNPNGFFDYDEGYITLANNETGDSDQIYVIGSGSNNILFESFENEFPPSGWTIFSNNTNNSVTQSNSRAHSGNYAARFSSYWTAESGDYTQYIITPQVYVPNSGATFSMFYITNWTFWTGLSPESFMIGVSTSGADTSNFSWFDEFVVSEGEWNEHIEDLSTYAGQNVHVAIKYTSIYLQNLHIDDIQISPGGTGPQPVITLSHEEIPVMATIIDSSSSITFSITNSGVGDLSGTITYPDGFSGPTSFVSNDTEIEVSFSPETSGVFGGWIEIQSNGGYENVYIEGSAGKSIATWESSWPQGWTTMQNNGDGWQFFGPTGARTGTGYAGAEWPNANTADWLISPTYSVESNSSFSFYASMGPGGTSVDIMEVYLSPTGGDQSDDFTILLDNVYNAGPYYLPYSYDLSDYAGTSVRIGILYTSEGVGNFTGWELNVDDVAGPQIINEIGPSISEYPDQFNFGVLAAGLASNALFDFYNIGSSNLEITNVYFDPPGVFSVGTEITFPHITEPNDSNGFYISFNPPADVDSVYSSEMIVVSNMGYDLIIPLEGEGTTYSPPGATALIEPASGSALIIDGSNHDGQTQFIWQNAESSDEYPVEYILELIVESTGDTLDTLIADNMFSFNIYNLSHAEILDYIVSTGETLIEIKWNVYTFDGLEAVESSNGPWSLTIDAGWALSIYNEKTPNVFALGKNYPNPFNPTTTIQYSLPKNTLVKITVYDMVGRKVRHLVNRFQSAGFKSVRWDATNDRNEPVSAGLYFYTIKAGDYKKTKRMILLK